MGVETLENEFVGAELLRPGHFNDSTYRGANRYPSNRCGNIVSRHGLDAGRRQSNSRAVAGSISDILDKLEELGRVDDREWD